MSRAVYPASALVEREATFSGVRPLGPAAPNRSSAALVFAFDFNVLGIALQVLRALAVAGRIDLSDYATDELKK